MQWTPEHQQLRETVERFVREEINPYTAGWEEEKTFPAHEICKKLGDLGLLGISKPEEYGGLGLDYSYSVVWAEALSTCNVGGVPMAIGVVTDMSTPALARFGSDELRKEYLAPTIAGDMVSAIGVSEPSAGSDVAAIKTTARREGDEYVINGSKMWITNGMQADWICLLANTSEGHPHKNKSLFVVPMDAVGVERSKKLDKLGMWSSDTAQLFFDNVRIPARYLIGQEGAGFMYQMLQFQEERLFGAAGMYTSAELLVDQTIEYTRERHTFGKPLIDNQVIHFRMAELQTEIEACRALTYRALEDYIRGKDVTKWASMAKLKAGRLVREVADTCMQYWGGMGYMWESPTAQAIRDQRLMSIGAGADEIMLGIICKYLNILPGKSK